jgi:transposase InsO family protein
LAVVLDAFSRKVVGWALDRSIATQLAIDALQRAVANRRPAPGWSITQIEESDMPRPNTEKFWTNTELSQV